MNWLELSAIANKRVMLGLGALLVCLDKRGLDLTQREMRGKSFDRCWFMSEKNSTQNAPEYRN